MGKRLNPEVHLKEWMGKVWDLDKETYSREFLRSLRDFLPEDQEWDLFQGEEVASVVRFPERGLSIRLLSPKPKDFLSVEPKYGFLSGSAFSLAPRSSILKYFLEAQSLFYYLPREVLNLSQGSHLLLDRETYPAIWVPFFQKLGEFLGETSRDFEDLEGFLYRLLSQAEGEGWKVEALAGVFQQWVLFLYEFLSSQTHLGLFSLYLDDFPGHFVFSFQFFPSEALLYLHRKATTSALAFQIWSIDITGNMSWKT